MSKCNRLGCLNPGVGQGRCEAHGGVRKDKYYGRKIRDHHKLYNTAQWQALRKNILYKYPTCQRCQTYGYLTAGVDVDHVQPHRGNSDLFYNLSNLQTLCRSCHSWKSQREGDEYDSDLDFRNDRAE